MPKGKYQRSKSVVVVVKPKAEQTPGYFTHAIYKRSDEAVMRVGNEARALEPEDGITKWLGHVSIEKKFDSEVAAPAWAIEEGRRVFLLLTPAEEDFIVRSRERHLDRTEM
jgi:hypothetical protein